jgi:calpain-15
MDIFRRTIEDCQDDVFTDHEFPPTMESILGTSRDSSKMDDINRFCNEWTRASDFPSADDYAPEIFREGISPNDIKQGMLGDCYFVAALASLAEWPHRIERIFASTRANEKQVFGVNLYKDGIFQTIIVDNYFPVFNRNVNRVRKANGEELGKEGEPIFAAAYGNELWVALAEKAYAKAHHGYVIIAGGSCGPTMRDLCGAPAYTYIFEEGNYPENLWESIIEGERMNYAMSAGTPGVDEG